MPPVGGSMERFVRSLGSIRGSAYASAVAGQDDSADSARRLAQLCVGLISAGPYSLGRDHGFGLAQISFQIERFSFTEHVIEAAAEPRG